uniref:Uncharacterized protein n=1 Tax=Riboviria sp. TaxID=2585031 RepID=A0A8K1U3G9_9VIRU|nr:MAG: hypothetical protein 1 [Riboviria sp.]
MIDPLRISPEGMIPGSKLLDGGRIPSCQVCVAWFANGAHVVVGAGIRVEDHLVLPAHNTHNEQGLYIVYGGSKVYKVTTPQVELAADLIAFHIPDTVWSQMGVSRARLSPMAKTATVQVTASTNAQYSIGSLKIVEPMGRVAYVASTMPGFSGSAYMDGNACKGIHLHGGASGGGYEMMYVWVRLKHALQQNPESSEDFLRGLVKPNRRLLTEALDGNYAVVRTTEGHYHLTTAQAVEKIRELEAQSELGWADEVELHDLRTEFGDYQPEALLPHFSGEYQPPAMVPSRSGQQGPYLPAGPSSTQSSEPQLTARLQSAESANKHLQKQLDRLTQHLLQLNPAAKGPGAKRPTRQQSPQPIATTDQPTPRRRRSGRASQPSSQTPRNVDLR